MSRNGKERAGQLPDARLVEVLQVLTGQDHAGLLFADPLEAVPDIGHRHRIGKPEVQLIDGGHRISGGEKLVRQIGEHAEQQGIPQILGRILQTLDAEYQESGRRDVGVSVEEARVRALAHGVEPQKQIQEHLCREELQPLFMAIAAVGILNDIVEVR